MQKILLALILFVVIDFDRTPSLAQAPTPDNAETATDEAATLSEPQRKVLAADIDHAIQLLDDEDLSTFIDLYFPFEMQQQFRKEKRKLPDVAAEWKRDHVRLAFLKAKLKEARAGKWDGNDDEVRTFPIYKDDPLLPENPKPVAKPGPIYEPPGYGNDFAKAIDLALSDLKAGKHEAFFSSMLPLSEVQRFVEPGQVDSYTQIFALYPEMTAAIVKDLEQAAQRKPQPEMGVIRVEIPSQFPGEKTREIRFELVDKHWRFFDQSREIQASLTPLLKSQRKIAVESSDPILEFERVRDHWRLKRLPEVPRNLRQ